MKITSEVLRALSLVSQLGLMMAIPIIFCIWFGNFLDSTFHTGYLFLIIFTILGAGAAFRNLYVYAMKAFKK